MVLIFCFLSFAATSKAAVWENVPALPQAQKVKQEETLINNNPVQTTIYTTATESKEIAEFYKTKLTNFGWKLETETAQQGVNLMAFSKQNKILNIMVQNIIGKNFISIAQSIAPKEVPKETPCPECQKTKKDLIEKLKLKLSKGEEIKEDDLPKDLFPKEPILPDEDSPGRDLQFIPRYPGAIRTNSVEKEGGKKVSLTYFAKDSVEKVVNFYRQNMGNYYWKLDKEVDFQNLPEALSEKINVDIIGQSLVFKSPSASCIISITEEPQTKSTIIGVNYNEK